MSGLEDRMNGGVLDYMRFFLWGRKCRQKKEHDGNRADKEHMAAAENGGGSLEEEIGWYVS